MSADLADRLRSDGAIILPRLFPTGALLDFRAAASACFDSLSPSISYSVPLETLQDFGIADVRAPLQRGAFDEVLSQLTGAAFECRIEHAWARKRFAPAAAPRLYSPNIWHQDGGLGVHFDPGSRDVPAMTRLLTLWVPLQHITPAACPGLEFVLPQLDRLLHPAELNDIVLRERFPASAFWIPEVQFGDALLFAAGTLHRTHVHGSMHENRLSIDYRFFPT